MLDPNALLDLLVTAPDAEVAARRLLIVLLDGLQAWTAQSPGGHEARPLRALLHVRGARGYRGLVVEDRGVTDAAAAWDASHTAWGAVERHRLAVDADVETGLFGTSEGTSWVEDLSEPAEGFADTGVQLKARDATHLVALPLRLHKDLLGMVTLELSAPDLAGARLPLWPDPGQRLQALVDLSAPFLEHMPEQVPEDAEGIPFAGPALRRILGRLRAFAGLPGAVLLVGETGTGKTHLARWIHARSPQKEGPFVCADLHTCSDEQIEAQLFGVARGAYTGVGERAGRAEEASGGTLFIDELDSLSWRAQTTLLNLLSERRFRRMGEGKERAADFRVIAGASPRLLELVREGRFRQDLYRRVEVTPFVLPPLRARPEEIAGWADLFLCNQHRLSGGTGTPGLSPAAARVLEARPWPGNLRELDAVVYRAYGLALAGASPTTRRRLRVDSGHVEEALQMGLVPEVPPKNRGVSVAWMEAAHVLLDVLPDHPADGLELKRLGSAFAGAVVTAALNRSRSPKEAAAKLGRSTKGGQHLEAFRTYRGHLMELLRALGEPLPDGLEDEIDTES